jgi:hypothetical protein
MFVYNVLLMLLCLFAITNGEALKEAAKVAPKEANNETAKMLPFSSIKMKDDEIWVSLDPKRETWHKLLSINSVGSDALVNFSRTHYGELPCDYEIECYKYNIIVNFQQVYQKLNESPLPKWVPMEFAEDGEESVAYQNGMDVESTEEKYKINEQFVAENIKLSKNNTKIFVGVGNSLFKGLKDSIQSIFGTDNSINDGFMNVNMPENSQEIKKEITEMKKEIAQMEKQELEIEKVKLCFNF